MGKVASCACLIWIDEIDDAVLDKDDNVENNAVRAELADDEDVMDDMVGGRYNGWS